MMDSQPLLPADKNDNRVYFYPRHFVNAVLMLFILALAVYVNYLPHRNYPYPLHLDEWSAISLTNELFDRQHMASLSDPYTGGEMTFWQFTEAGFHLELGTLQRICNLPWKDLFRLLPAVMSALTVLAVYAAARRRGFGWEATFFAALLPTSVGVLGPAFFVPVTMAVIFLPLSVILAYDFDDFPSLLFLFLMVLVMLFTHAFTAIAVVIFLMPFLVLHLKKDTKRSLALAAALLLPFLLLLPWGLPYIRQISGFLSAPQYPSPFVDYPRLVLNYGYLPAILLVTGSFYLVWRDRLQDYGLVLGLVAWLLVMVAYHIFHFGLGGVYERGFLYTGLMMSVVSGAGLSWISQLRLRKFSGHAALRFASQQAGKVFYAVIIVLCLVTVLPIRHHAGYYHMIDNRDYRAFTWMKEHLTAGYEKALLDPWKATAFTALTGRKVFSRTTMATSGLDRQIYAYLESGVQDSRLLMENDITIVYSPVAIDNPDLIRVGQDIYLLTRLVIPDFHVDP